MKTETMLLLALIVAVGAYALGQRNAGGYIPAASPAPEPAGVDDGGVMVSATMVEYADQYGPSDTTGDPELDALVNGYGIGDGAAGI